MGLIGILAFVILKWVLEMTHMLWIDFDKIPQVFWIVLAIIYFVYSFIWAIVVSMVVASKGYHSITRWVIFGLLFHELAFALACGLENLTLRNQNDEKIKYLSDQINELKRLNAGILKENEWRCSCGRVNSDYVTTCLCGKAKEDSFADEIDEKEQKPTLKK